MINEEINRLLDKKNSLKDRHEQYLMHLGVKSLVRLRTNFVQFIECDSQKKDGCQHEWIAVGEFTGRMIEECDKCETIRWQP